MRFSHTVVQCLFLMTFIVTLAACATSVPRVEDYYDGIQGDDISLPIDLDLLETARLSSESQDEAASLLIAFRELEQSLQRYRTALDQAYNANEGLHEKYDTADAIIGGIAGLSSISVIFATAAIAAPIVGVLWIATSLGIDHLHIQPQQKRIDTRRQEINRELEKVPDIQRTFDALIFADSPAEAERRFKRWRTYAREFQQRGLALFRQYASDGRRTR
jgi:hypothetical protein